MKIVILYQILDFVKNIERVQLDFMDLTKKIEEKFLVNYEANTTKSSQNETKKLA